MNRSHPPQILIVDDHELILTGTLKVLKESYQESQLIAVKTVEEALEKLQVFKFDLIIIDLSLPENPLTLSKIETGIQFLKQLMQNYPILNIMVQSVYIRALIQIKHDIDQHQGGFTLANKTIGEQELLTRIQWALSGLTYTKDIRTGLEFKEEWIELLKLAADGLSDIAIANQMQKKERTVRNYWSKVQDILGIYSHKSINLRVVTLKRAREEGLID